MNDILLSSFCLTYFEDLIIFRLKQRENYHQFSIPNQLQIKSEEWYLFWNTLNSWSWNLHFQLEILQVKFFITTSNNTNINV